MMVTRDELRVAAGLQGKPRLTEDIDAVIFGGDADTLIRTGKRFGFEPRISDAAEFSRRTHVVLRCDVRHRDSIG